MGILSEYLDCRFFSIFSFNYDGNVKNWMVEEGDTVHGFGPEWVR